VIARLLSWLIGAVGATVSVIILVTILTLAGLGALVCYSLCVVSGRAAQFEEDHFGIRRS